MKDRIKPTDIAVLRDIAANQLSPLSKMETYIENNYEQFPNKVIKEIAKDILDMVAGELGFQTKYSEVCK